MNIDKALLFIAAAWIVWTLACAVKAGPKPRRYTHLSSERFGKPFPADCCPEVTR